MSLATATGNSYLPLVAGLPQRCEYMLTRLSQIVVPGAPLQHRTTANQNFFVGVYS